MGQCTSRKATGSLTTKSSFVSHIKPFKMEKYNNCKSKNDDKSRKTRGEATNETSQLLSTKKPQQKHSKGVAMSFGFKRRPTPMTTKNGPIHRDSEHSGASTDDIDPNGNKDDTANFVTRNQSEKDKTVHKIPSSQKPTSINLRQSRSGFHQTTTDRTNKVSDIKTAPSPIEFGGLPHNGNNRSRPTSPATETDTLNDRRVATFARNVPKKGTVERMTSPNTDQVMTNNDRRTEFFTRNTYRREPVEQSISPTTAHVMSNNDRRTEFFTRNTTADHVVSNNDRRSASARTFSRAEPAERRTSPTFEPFLSKDQRARTFTRNVSRAETVGQSSSPTAEHNLITNDWRTRAFATNVGKIESTEKRMAVFTDSNDNTAGVKDRLGGGQIQVGKFTLQTTRLPQPEPIRVIETKTAKTIANNNKRSARIRRQFEDTSMKVDEDSGFGSNASGYLDENNPTTNLRYIDAPTDNRIRHGLKSNIMENSDSFSETGTTPPLPELPSVFHTNSTRSTSAERHAYKGKHDSNSPFIQLGSQRFLKTKTSGSDSSLRSSSEPDWSNAGEAMAEDSSLIPASPKHKTYDNKDFHDRCASSRASIAGTALQTLTKPSVSLELTPNLKLIQKISLLDEDPCFTAVAANNKTGHLLDEEILSPVESLLSCSEAEEILKKKMPHSSSNSKDINEKLTPASPDPPSNGTYSLSLSDDKDDFLIDDEIADQPELVFEDNINMADNGSFTYIPETTSAKIEDSIRNQRIRSFEVEASPLPSRRRRDFLRSLTETIDSLSPCESIASDDLMMEFDISQSNEIEGCDRRSGSFSSFDDTLRFRLNSEYNTHLANKNVFKSSTLKPIMVPKPDTPNYAKESPRSVRRQFSYQSSPEHTRSPKHKPLHQFVYNSMSMAYDPTSDCLTLTKANHSAIQQDIIGIKTMLLTLKRVLNESETRNSLNNDMHGYPCENDIIQNNNNHSEFKVELADLRRQVIFLQGQLEDKETTVNNLQKQIANQDNQIIVNTPVLLPLDIQNRCNAATQTDRIRPISSGSLTLSSSMEESGSLVRFLVK